MSFSKLLLTILFISFSTQADVVKPALIEISIYPDKKVEVVINLSLEMAMTDIGTQYKNTADAPNSKRYDELRALTADKLQQYFKNFEVQFLDSIQLMVNQQVQTLSLEDVKIDIIGYKKRPRKTILTYTTFLKKWPQTITWQYNKTLGDSAFRWQIFKKDEYNWSQWQWLKNGDSSGLINTKQAKINSTFENFVEFVRIGFSHVAPLGWDHVLFIIGMALSTLIWRRLFLLVSIFTLAHTLTLGLAMIGIVSVSNIIIEPLIAFSIAYVAIENLLTHQSIKRKSIVVFLFGLIHGLGFATMLQEFKMTPDSFLTTLIGFNVGVELAQITIVVLIFLILSVFQLLKLNHYKLITVPISIIIALIGFYWGIERLFII